MLTPLKHPLNILRHDLPYTLDLPLCSPERILLSSLRTSLLQHHPFQRTIETRTPIWRQVVKICTPDIEFLEEFLLQIRQKAKGYALSQIAFGNDEKGETTSCGFIAGIVLRRLDETVDEELGLVDCFMGRGFVGDSREDEGDERGGVGGGRGRVLGQDGCVVGYACV